MLKNRTHIRRARLAPALVALLLFALLALPATAQGPTLTIAEASLRLWPEYDDPGLLVIFGGTLTGATAFPQEVAFPLPANARNIQATYQDASAGLLTRPWQLVGDKLTYTLPAPDFHIEYYVDRSPSGDERVVSHVFEAPYAIQALTVMVQEPARATGFSLTPPAEQTILGEDGLTYHVFERKGLAAGEKLEIQLRYTKTDSGLSKPQLMIPNAPASTPTPASTGSKPADWLPWILIGVGGAFLLGAAGYWFRSRWREAPEARPARVAERPAQRTPAAPTKTAAAAFCTQCGRPLRPDDRFCSHCGAPRRS